MENTMAITAGPATHWGNKRDISAHALRNSSRAARVGFCPPRHKENYFDYTGFDPSRFRPNPIRRLTKPSSAILSALELGPVDPGFCSLPCLTLMESDLRVLCTP